MCIHVTIFTRSIELPPPNHMVVKLMPRVTDGLAICNSKLR
jgi:hypothetical protein